MRKDIEPVQWADQQAVVALPTHVDASNAGQIREELLSVINGGATALIADMSATISCDHAGADAVVCAFQRARYQRYRVAAGGHRPARLADAQLQRPGPYGFPPTRAWKPLPAPASQRRRSL